VIDVVTAQNIAGTFDVAAGRALLTPWKRQTFSPILATGGRRRTWECRGLFDLADDFERDLAAAPGEGTAARPAP